MSAGRFRRIELVRGAWGAALLVAPQQVLGTVHNVKVDTKAVVVARILGARQLTQAVLSGFRPTAEVLAMGVWVDSLHALTALGLAVVDRSRVRAGITDTAIAAVWGAAGYRDLVHSEPTSPSHQRIRDKLARAVLSVVPGGQFLRSRVYRG
ncbi:MAG TPA: hypothetical protein VH496_10405 [Mycobacterium sp.]|jgi:hypothetical protein